MNMFSLIRFYYFIISIWIIKVMEAKSTFNAFKLHVQFVDNWYLIVSKANNIEHTQLSTYYPKITRVLQMITDL